MHIVQQPSIFQLIFCLPTNSDLVKNELKDTFAKLQMNSTLPLKNHIFAF